jgi:putative acetyltransferase
VISLPTNKLLRVRQFRSDDVDTLIALFRDSVRVVARRDYTQEQVMAWAPDDVDRGAWRSRCGARETFVAEIGDSIVGFTELERDGHLDMMFVHPEHQGRGVASALLAHVESAARCLDLARIYTEASVTARPFFEHRGFCMIASQLIRIRGQEFPNYRMEKPLQF